MWKFLDPTLATYYNNTETIYSAPRNGEKWGPWLEHTEPAEPDGKDCGPGAYHLMKELNATYAPRSWVPWWAQGDGLVGESEEKARYHRVRIRRVSPAVFHRYLRLGGGQGANLRGANLRGANLREADLREADLWGANLRGANLRGADLRGANLREADLWGADLREADLREADLWGANLREADLWGADLRGADLRGANLREADLREADLREAVKNNYTRWPKGFDSEGAIAKL